MARKVKPFGKGSMSYESGYCLNLIVGHLENLIEQEEENCQDLKSKRQKLIAEKLIEKAGNALQELYEILSATRE